MAYSHNEMWWPFCHEEAPLWLKWCFDLWPQQNMVASCHKEAPIWLTNIIKLRAQWNVAVPERNIPSITSSISCNLTILSQFSQCFSDLVRQMKDDKKQSIAMHFPRLWMLQLFKCMRKKAQFFKDFFL